MGEYRSRAASISAQFFSSIETSQTGNWRTKKKKKKKKEKGTIREASVITVMERCLLIESSRREKESEREREETEENTW